MKPDEVDKIKNDIKRLPYVESFSLRLNLLVADAKSPDLARKLRNSRVEIEKGEKVTPIIEHRVAHIFNTSMNGIIGALEGKELFRQAQESNVSKKILEGLQRNTITFEQAKDLISVLVKRIIKEFPKNGEKEIRVNWNRFIENAPELGDVDQYLK